MSLTRKLTAVLRPVTTPRMRGYLGRLQTRMLSAMPAHRPSVAAVSDAGTASPFDFPIDRRNLLEELGEKYLPTKRLHNYLPYYWLHFRDIRLDVKRVLEIGVETGRSLQMWEEFFPNAVVYGVDIRPECKNHEGGRRRVRIGDQSDPAFLRALVEEAGAFDVIIDDGSHRIDHQLASFGVLFPALTEHGIYVMEDTGGCVDDFGLRTVSSLKTLVDDIMYWPREYRGSWEGLSQFADDSPWTSRNVIGIAFYRWIVFVMRGRNPGDNPHLGRQAAG